MTDSQSLDGVGSTTARVVAPGACAEDRRDGCDLHHRDVQPRPAGVGHRLVGRVGKWQLQQRRQPRSAYQASDRAQRVGHGRAGIAHRHRRVRPVR